MHSVVPALHAAGTVARPGCGTRPFAPQARSGGATALLLAAAVCCALFTGPAGAAATLEVRLDHLRPSGSLHVALYRDAASWRRQQGAYTERTVRTPASSETLRFDGLPPGRYAVSARQDADDDALHGPLLLALPRRGDSGGGAQLQASFEHAAISVGEADPSVRVHLYTDSQY